MIICYGLFHVRLWGGSARIHQSRSALHESNRGSDLCSFLHFLKLKHYLQLSFILSSCVLLWGKWAAVSCLSHWAPWFSSYLFFGLLQNVKPSPTHLNHAHTHRKSERERERWREIVFLLCLPASLCVHWPKRFVSFELFSHIFPPLASFDFLFVWVLYVDPLGRNSASAHFLHRATKKEKKKEDFLHLNSLYSHRKTQINTQSEVTAPRCFTVFEILLLDAILVQFPLNF